MSQVARGLLRADGLRLWDALSMTTGMTTQKIAISVPQSTLTKARRAVKSGRASSLSAYVSQAIEQTAMLEDLDELLQELLNESGGPMTAAERRTADRVLGAQRRSTKGKRK